MGKITFDSLLSKGLLAPEGTADFIAQMDIFSHRFDLVPNMIRSGAINNLSAVTRELLACYLEGKVKTIGKFKRPEDKTKFLNLWLIGKIYDELVDNYKHHRKRLLIAEIRKRCRDLVGSNGKPLTERTFRGYFDEYELLRHKRTEQGLHVTAR